MITAQRLTRKFGRFLAVDAVDFEIPRGQVVGFLGPNGAGKTTTLRMICGYLRPTAGSVHVDGHDMAVSPRRGQRLIGYLPESAPVYAEMRVQEYLAFRARLFGVPRAARRKAIDRAMGQCSLVDVRRRPIHQLSKGYRQRVGLAAALVHEPPILVLDEPTSGLDPTQVRQVRALIRELAGSRTILLSTHNLAEVELTCDRILMFARGRLRASGTIDELRGAAAGESRYIVECDAADATAALKAIPGVGRVESAAPDGAWYRLTVIGENGAQDLREAIARVILKTGGSVRELHREAPTLERLFVRIVEETEPEGAAG
ncbi:MAG: ABC transporter ATP-binding protein [Planctomycetota bacterium]|nr:MAG: ABC transporter ATP-binding protein [Planctomycetota bacterium]